MCRVDIPQCLHDFPHGYQHYIEHHQPDVRGQGEDRVELDEHHHVGLDVLCQLGVLGKDNRPDQIPPKDEVNR